MALTRKNWTLNTYTNSTWTDLVAEESTIATLTFANTTASAVNVLVRLEDSGTGLATILPTFSLEGNAANVIDVRSINVTGTQKIQVQADATGIEFLASGVIG